MIYDFLDTIDVLVLPSITEGYANVMLEAANSCVSLICSNVGGAKDFIVNGETGFLFSPLNCIELADKIVQSKDPALRNKFASLSKKRLKSDVVEAAEWSQLYFSVTK
jgi:L-malate glycosyltransferase